MEELTPEEIAENILWEEWQVKNKIPAQDVPAERVAFENPHGTEWRIVREGEVTCHRPERCAVDNGQVSHEAFASLDGDHYCNRHTFGYVRYQVWACRQGYEAVYFADANDVWDLGAN